MQDKKVDKDHEKRRKRKSDSTTTTTTTTTTVLEPEPPEKTQKVDVEEINSDEESKVSSTEDATAIVQPKSEVI